MLFQKPNQNKNATNKANNTSFRNSNFPKFPDFSQVSKFSKFASLGSLVTFTTILATSFGLIFSLNSPIVEARPINWAGSKFMIVTNLRGLNVRDKNCNIIGRVGDGTVLEKGADTPKQTICKVGQTDLLFVNYWSNDVKTTSTEQFVSVNFIQNIITDNTPRNKKLPNLVIKNEAGANLRGGACQKVLTVPNKTVSSKDITITGNDKTVCKVGGDFYMMTDFIHKNANYYVAEVLTKYE